MNTRRFRSIENGTAALRAALGVDDAPPRTLVIAAHPDDEVIGAAGQLMRLGVNAQVVYVTDGTPHDPADARRAGFGSAEEYARQRCDEAMRALALAAVPASHCWSLGFGDQRASFSLVAVARAIQAAIEETSAPVVLTHAYEGGHPDHDATAFGVAAACNLLAQRRAEPPLIVEFTSYHRGRSGMESGVFLPSASVELELGLTEAMQTTKRSMLGMFATQQRALEPFTGDAAERYRIAPIYDFTTPPHGGRLYYEDFNCGVDGLKWRALARAALAELG